MRTFLISLAAFVFGTAAVYFAILIGVTTAWQFMGIHDRDGGGAMGLAFVIGPAIALPAGIVIAFIVAARLRRNAQLRAAGELPEPTQGRKRLTVLASALAGFFAAYFAVRIVYWVAGPFYSGFYPFAFFLAWLPDIAGVAAAFWAGFAAARGQNAPVAPNRT